MGLSQKLLLEQCEKKKNAKTTKISIIFLIILLPSILFTPTQTLSLFFYRFQSKSSITIYH